MPRSEPEFVEALKEEASAFPLWRFHNAKVERPKVLPHVWRWSMMERFAQEAGDLPELKGQGDRRALVMSNPGLKMPFSGATKTLTSAIQIVWPGEIATAHRHTPAAIRFIIQGNGAFTVQDGERFIMDQGDFTLTPSFVWHDHGNLTEKPMIWLDVLDAPLVGYLDASFFEDFPEDEQPIIHPEGYTNVRVGHGLMRGLADRPAHNRPLPVTYKWDQAYGALRDFDQSTPFDGVAMEYINPITGGHCMPTVAAVLSRLRPGERTGAHRHTATTIYHVAKGSGFSIVDGKELAWSKGDTFTLPSWTWHEHGNGSSTDDAVLFSVSDLPLLEAVGLFREEEGNPQQVTGSFD
ncbi:MAG: cupin domain-containing protein [Chloroflexota bacterium]